MRIGYARVSTGDQNLDLQVDALSRAGCEQIFHDKISGAIDERPGLVAALNAATPGSTFCVWKLDRLGRSLPHLLAIVNGLRARNVEFISLTETIDSTSPTGKLVFHLMSALSEFERDLIRNRTRAGLAAARERGRIGGRPSKLDSEKAEIARKMLSDGNVSAASICPTLGISRATLYRSLAKF